MERNPYGGLGLNGGKLRCARGWVGAWPPERARIESADDCEHYLARLEAGEQRAGFLSMLSTRLVDYFDELKPEHFARFARVMYAVAENPEAAHRSRLRAAQAAPRLIERAVLRLVKLQQFEEYRALEIRLQAFMAELSTDRLSRLAGVLLESTGQGARSTSDMLRAANGLVSTMTASVSAIIELDNIDKPVDMNDPEVRRHFERAQRELSEIRANGRQG